MSNPNTKSNTQFDSTFIYPGADIYKRHNPQTHDPEQSITREPSPATSDSLRDTRKMPVIEGEEVTFAEPIARLKKNIEDALVIMNTMCSDNDFAEVCNYLRVDARRYNKHVVAERIKQMREVNMAKALMTKLYQLYRMMGVPMPKLPSLHGIVIPEMSIQMKEDDGDPTQGLVGVEITKTLDSDETHPETYIVQLHYNVPMDNQANGTCHHKTDKLVWAVRIENGKICQTETSPLVYWMLLVAPISVWFTVGLWCLPAVHRSYIASKFNTTKSATVPLIGTCAD